MGFFTKSCEIECLPVRWCVQILEKVSSQYEASYQEAKAKYNAGKNRFQDKLPSKYITSVCFHCGYSYRGIHNLSHAFHKCVLSLSLSTVCFDPWATDRVNVSPPPLKTKVHLLMVIDCSPCGVVYATQFSVFSVCG